jgi:hypothetical protein
VTKNIPDGLVACSRDVTLFTIGDFITKASPHGVIGRETKRVEPSIKN